MGTPYLYVGLMRNGFICQVEDAKLKNYLVQTSKMREMYSYQTVLLVHEGFVRK